MKLPVMRSYLFGLVLAAASAPGAEPGPAAALPPDLPLAAFSAVGSAFAQGSQLPELGWSEAQINAFTEGVRAALHGKSYPFDETARLVSNEMGRRIHELNERAKLPSVAAAAPSATGFDQTLKQARKSLGLQKTDSGLYYRVNPGLGGTRPRPVDTVVFSCTTTTADGKTTVAELSFTRARLKMTDLIPGLREGLQMMTVDSNAVFVLPPALSLGSGDWPAGVARDTPLFLAVTLHEVSDPDAVR